MGVRNCGSLSGIPEGFPLGKIDASEDSVSSRDVSISIQDNVEGLRHL